MNTINILGTKISCISRDQLVSSIKEHLESPDSASIFVATPNPEFVLMARKDKEFQNALNSAQYAICDGVGLQYAAWFLGEKFPERITGADLMNSILTMAHERNLRICCVAASGGLSIVSEIERGVQKRFPKLQIFVTATESTHPLLVGDLKKTTQTSLSTEKLIDHINTWGADIVLVGLGQGVQEKWIYRHRDRMKNVGIFMGVGGSFDYLTGKRMRAPLFIRQLGVEWLWRVMIQPRRFGRIWRAVVVFPLMVFISRFCYR